LPGHHQGPCNSFAVPRCQLWATCCRAADAHANQLGQSFFAPLPIHGEKGCPRCPRCKQALRAPPSTWDLYPSPHTTGIIQIGLPKSRL
jgi:hypothetical protein